MLFYFLEDAETNDKTEEIIDEIGPEILSASGKLEYYCKLLQTNQFEGAGKARDELMKILESVEKSPQKVFDYALDLVNDENDYLLDALFFNQFTVHLCVSKKTLSNSDLCFMTNSFKEIAQIVDEAVEDAILSKHMVFSHIVPFLMVAKNYVIETFKEKSAACEGLTEVIANQSFFISLCQLEAHDFIGSRFLMTKTIKKLKAEFKEKINDHKIYSLCLICLGVTYLRKKLLLKAEKKLKKAQIALEKATDCEGNEEKEQVFLYVQTILETSDEFFDDDDDDDDDDDIYLPKPDDIKRKRKLEAETSSQRAKVLKQEETDKASTSKAQLAKKLKTRAKKKSSKKRGKRC